MRLDEGQRLYLEFAPVEECPIVGQYIIRVMKRFEIRDKEGKLVKDLSKNGK